VEQRNGPMIIEFGYVVKRLPLEYSAPGTLEANRGQQVAYRYVGAYRSEMLFSDYRDRTTGDHWLSNISVANRW
jgi:hypothetical protein